MRPWETTPLRNTSSKVIRAPALAIAATPDPGGLDLAEAATDGDLTVLSEGDARIRVEQGRRQRINKVVHAEPDPRLRQDGPQAPYDLGLPWSCPRRSSAARWLDAREGWKQKEIRVAIDSRSGAYVMQTKLARQSAPRCSNRT